MTKKARKQDKHQSKLLIITGICGLLLAFSLLLSRGWIQDQFTSKPVNNADMVRVTETYQTEMAKLGDPIGLLGYTEPTTTDDNCSSVPTRGLQPIMSCGLTVNAFKEVDLNNKDTLNANAAALQSALQANGWQGQYVNENTEYNSLVKLVSSITSGIDYEPDATYTKDIGDVTCSISTTTAFSSPKPPAMNTNIWCGVIVDDPNAPLEPQG